MNGPVEILSGVLSQLKDEYRKFWPYFPRISFGHHSIPKTSIHDVKELTLSLLSQQTRHVNRQFSISTVLAQGTAIKRTKICLFILQICQLKSLIYYLYARIYLDIASKIV